MFPANQNGGAAKASEAASSTGPPSSNPSAPLLPYNPQMQNLEPPPYSSVVAQDTGDWKNRSGSFSGATVQPYPPASPHLNGAKSTPGLQNQTPYPSGPPSAPGPAVAQPYPSYGPSAPAQAMGQGSGPQFGTAPYPPGPAGPGFASQPPYPVAGNQPPYPTGPPTAQIGFTAPVTTEPRPMEANTRFEPFPMGRNSAISQQGPYGMGGQGTQDGLIYPKQSNPDNQYMQQNQYVPNQYAQQQQPPQTIYVVQKNPNESNNDVDDCCLLACCMASCYCLCECIKICASSDS